MIDKISLISVRVGVGFTQLETKNTNLSFELMERGGWPPAETGAGWPVVTCIRVFYNHDLMSGKGPYGLKLCMTKYLIKQAYIVD